MLKVKFTQKLSHGCGLYAAANLFDNAELIDKFIDDTKNGILLSDMNRYVMSINKNYRVNDLYSNHVQKTTPQEIFDYVADHADKNNVDVPTFLGLVYNNKKDARNHIIAAIFKPNGRVLLIDSNEQYIWYVSHSDLNEFEKFDIFSVYIITNKNDILTFGNNSNKS